MCKMIKLLKEINLCKMTKMCKMIKLFKEINLCKMTKLRKMNRLQERFKLTWMHKMHSLRRQLNQVKMVTCQIWMRMMMPLCSKYYCSPDSRLSHKAQTRKQHPQLELLNPLNKNCNGN